MFGKILALNDKVQALKMNEVLHEIIDQDNIKAEIVDLNTQKQLFNEGLQSDGTINPDYSDTSVNVYGKPPGPIKLFDTGDFYSTFKIQNNEDNFTIEANTLKDISDKVTMNQMNDNVTVDLLARFPKALGLTDESKGALITTIKPIFVGNIKSKIFAK